MKHKKQKYSKEFKNGVLLASQMLERAISIVNEGDELEGFIKGLYYSCEKIIESEQRFLKAKKKKRE